MATNYNYGHVVKNPDTGSYYYFISTISASVARADIATHANFQVIGGETGHAPSVDSGDTFQTAPVAIDIFFFNADVASGARLEGHERHHRLDGGDRRRHDDL